MVIKTDTLKFDQTKSVFHWNLFNTTSEIPPRFKQQFPNMVQSSDEALPIGQTTLYDTMVDSMFSRQTMRYLGEVLYVKEKTPIINWSISDSTKSLHGYNVQQATTMFRGRSYTAWFTPEIPVPYGPWKLHGLPGLILQAYDQSGNIYFNATDISLHKILPINPIPLTGNETILTLEEYKKMMNNFTSHQRNRVLKQVRQVVDPKELSSMDVNLRDVGLMEIFDEKTTEQ